ncbi:hypothetical protein AAP_05234 [Ascosphaera apis ARSEF 7405]|uniref:Uncharacterized protein n=1 Tax=Ascosphaera apis ARSEF 7405 TaxID=392613 RepID=A0A167VT58_9EURO|nr:hypothetical protein AAP_05234 [Ascosphaera apis ARSEF 7405]
MKKQQLLLTLAAYFTFFIAVVMGTVTITKPDIDAFLTVEGNMLLSLSTTFDSPTPAYIEQGTHTGPTRTPRVMTKAKALTEAIDTALARSSDILLLLHEVTVVPTLKDAAAAAAAHDDMTLIHLAMHQATAPTTSTAIGDNKAV